MAELSTEQIFNGTPAQVFEAIRQYSKYKEYIPGVTSTEVLPAQKKGSTCQVRYDLKFIKTFYYTLDMYEEPGKKIYWHLADSNLLKISNGSWDFTKVSDTETRAVYAVEVAFSGFVPNKVVEQITKANLPAMMTGFQKLIDDFHNK